MVSLSTELGNEENIDLVMAALIEQKLKIQAEEQDD